MPRVLLTRPPLPAVSGVSAFYRAVERHIADRVDVAPVEIGSLTSKPLHSVSDQFSLLSALGEGDYDVIHINPSLTMRGLLRDGLFFSHAKRRGLPILVHIHGWEHHTAARLTGGALGGFFRRTLAHGDAFIVLAEEFRDRLRELGITAPIHLGTTAVEDDLLTGFDIEEKQREVAAASELRVLFLARLEREKGVYETIDACARLVGEGLPIHLTIAGDGAERETVTRMATERLGGHVSIPGFILGEQKAEALHGSHVYVLPTTHAEGMPASVLEAMALGLPVITRPTGGLRDFFLDGEHGYFMDRADADVLASLIRTLAADQGLRARMSETAHRYAVARFLGSRVAASIVDVYGSLIA